MPSQKLSNPAYTTKELSTRTWPDFVRLFSQGSGWDFCQCMHYQRPRSLPKQQWLRPREPSRGATAHWWDAKCIPQPMLDYLLKSVPHPLTPETKSKLVSNCH